ncbi:ABC transporter ATP-binding protein/permease [Patescibacteria group bacterium]|nr:ABC transporter ATP-binding protein/permease [Patescibacteria group bacterium]MBU1015581.1 ABC transporter ATP-binding protein/permease [Patescibacteria group bacterium]MBU1684727.1 ABC transporter ATP-binding protein/permease [Patescibacteria group bacterium]MBU1938284.1 ABC transporter ATP-binding protein/permease [Patescibacteria group bacterium]
MHPSTKKTLKAYWKHSAKYKWLMLAMAVSMLGSTAIDLAVPYLFKVFFDTLSQAGAAQEIASKLIKILLLIAGGGMIQWVFQRGIHFSTAYFQTGVMRDLYNTCFEYLQKHSHRFFTDNFSGSLVKKVGRFVRSFEGFADRLYFDLIPLFLKIVFIFVILLWIKPIIGVIMLVWSVVFIISTLLFTRFKWKYDIAQAEMDTKVTGALADTITNNSNLKFFSTLPYEVKRFGKVTSKWAGKTVLSWNIGQIADAFQGLMMITLEFLIFYFAVRAWQVGEVTIGDFVWIQVYIFEIFRNIWRFGRNIRDLYRNLADAEEMTQVLEQEHEIRDVLKAKDIRIIRGRIEFKKVCFSYGSSDTEVVHGLSFKIKPGEKVALVGPSGGGKSTITKLILRLFDIQKGKIMIDGQDIARVTQDSLRSQISFVPQDPILFHRSLMDNIRYGRLKATDEEVIAAARLANCHEFIMNLPEKYNTYVGERGIKLSGGERQRVAIARAILANAPILILDEATSSLDSASEAQIQEALENLMKNKTTLVIAHRLSTITKMDRILVLQNGQIIEDGVHADLIHYKSGLYRKLWELQVGGYVD